MTNSRGLRPPPLSSSNPFINRLEAFVSLGVEERAAVEALCGVRRTVRAHETLVREGTRPDCIYLILNGVGFRYRFLANGRRQIFGYLLPGDLCDAQFVVLNECDHNVGVLCDTQVAVLSLSAMMKAMVEFPKLERALLLMSLVDSAMLREWLLNVGQRNASQKLAHFFCEMRARYRSLSLCTETNSFTIPLTQVELADTLGLTVVHVNRMLRRLRHEGLLSWRRRYVSILNYAQLERVADFDAGYLQLRRDGRREEEQKADIRVVAYTGKQQIVHVSVDVIENGSFLAGWPQPATRIGA